MKKKRCTTEQIIAVLKEAGSVYALESELHPERLDNGSRMSGDVHVRFCKRLGGKSTGLLNSISFSLSQKHSKHER